MRNPDGHHGMDDNVKGARAEYASGKSLSVLTRSPGCEAADRLVKNGGNSSPSREPIRAMKAGCMVSVSATDNLVGEIEGIVNHLKPLCQLFFGDDQGRDDEQGMPMGVQEYPMIR